MKRLIILFILFFHMNVYATTPSDFARKLCKEEPNIYKCINIKIPRKAKIQYKEWAELFSDKGLRYAEMTINRRNTLLWNGHTIATFRNFSHNMLDYAPFPHERIGIGSKFIVVDLNKLAWAAYYEPTFRGPAYLAQWGVANGGIKICPETGKLECKTPIGFYRIMELGKANKRSELYPIDCKDKKKCGHQMPFFMKFAPTGEGLHGNKWLTGKNSSHGCVRVLTDDARFLNKNFAFIGMPILIEDY